MKLFVRCSSLLLLLALVGCGGQSRTAVKGKVTVTGQGPLSGGSIQFVLAADTKVMGGGVIKADGTYEVPDAPVGECKVVIDNQHLAPKSGPILPGAGQPKDSSKMVGPGKDKGVEIIKGESTGKNKYVRIDPNHASAEKTTLKSTVSSSGATPSDFEIK